MRDLLTRAELVKLSRVLGTDAQAVAFLGKRDHLELRELEDRISAALFDEHRPALQRLADASRLLPASLVAKMSELVFGPVLSARVAGLMPPDRAIEVSTRLKTKFLADVTIQLDPRSASELLARMPTKIVVEVAQLLLQRREYVTMGRFVDDLTNEAIRAVLESVTDDTALITIGLYVERRERLAELIELVPDERLKRVVAAAATGPAEVQAAGLAMMSQLTHKQQGRFGEAAIAAGPQVLGALIEGAQREEASEVVASVMQNVGPAGRAAFAKMLTGMAPATLSGWARATTAANLWPAALQILAASNAEVQQQAARALEKLPAADRKTIAAMLRAEKLEQRLAGLRATLER
jgi:hypothetical protein